MTIDEAIEAMKNMSMGKHMPNIRMRAEQGYSGNLTLRLTMGPVINAETGADDGTYVTRLWQRHPMDIARMKPADFVKHIVAREVMNMVRHEAEEWLRFEGVRVIEPHEKDDR